MTFLLAIALLLPAQPTPDLRVRALSGGAVEVAAALTAAQQKTLPLGIVPVELGESWLRVGVLHDTSNALGPPMLGKYERSASELIFRPRFGFEPGRTYRVSFGPVHQPFATIDHKALAPRTGAPAAVTQIFPTADVLPANHLKFHIVFSRPMRGGQAIFKQIEILDADGNPVPDAWLTDELWDAEGKELILYIHPGRIKWGVVLREILGPVLVPRREYALAIRGAMLDADGQPLGKDVLKKFRTIDEDRVRVDLSDWTIASPKAGGRDPLAVAFKKPLDRSSLQKFLTVQDDMGRRVEGSIALGRDERSWSFSPALPWTNADYRLVVDPKLEDVAGNTPVRPFDLDLRAGRQPAQNLAPRFRPAP